MLNEPLEVTFKVTAVFEELDVPYFVSGSMASTWMCLSLTHDLSCTPNWHVLAGRLSSWRGKSVRDFPARKTRYFPNWNGIV